MNCDEVRPVLLDYVMEESPARDREAIAKHLETCAACSEEAGKFRQTLGALAAGAAFEDVPQKIRLVAEPANWWTAFWLNPARLALAASGVACIAIALLALAHTTVSFQQGNFEIAFGAAATPKVSSVTTPAAAPVSFTSAAGEQSITRAEAERLIAAAVAASEARQSTEAARLVKTASAQAETNRLSDRRELAESFRYVQAAQVNMWKQQVENQQYMTTLAERAGMDVAPQP